MLTFKNYPLHLVTSLFFVPIVVGICFLQMSCAKNSVEIKKEAFAKVGTSRVFEYPTNQVWEATRQATQDLPSPKEKTTDGLEIDTDWITQISKDKYVNYKVNGHIRHRPLTSRVKFEIQIKSHLAGSEVVIKIAEEVEKLKKDGQPDGFVEVEKNQMDTSRAEELLDRIQLQLLKK